MTAMDLEARIAEFVKRNFYVAGALERDASLLDRGIIDSTGVLELVGFVETEFGFRIPDEDILPENLDSIARLAAYVERKRGTRAA